MKRTLYNKNLRDKARQLRNFGTKGEAIMWSNLLRDKKMNGYQFNRQRPIGNYIVDFISRKLRLIIEIDGYSHQFKYNKDQKRDIFFKQEGYTVIRFAEKEVLENLDDVRKRIEYYIEEFEKEKQNLRPPSSEGGVGR